MNQYQYNFSVKNTRTLQLNNGIINASTATTQPAGDINIKAILQQVPNLVSMEISP
ncbi:MAG: hypothetical protein AAFX46_13045 [Cyanobacteria bacterium J06636_27]